MDELDSIPTTGTEFVCVWDDDGEGINTNVFRTEDGYVTVLNRSGKSFRSLTKGESFPWDRGVEYKLFGGNYV